MVTTKTVLGLTIATLVVFTAMGIYASRGRFDSAEYLITARNSAGGGQLTATLIASVMGVWILLSAPEAGASFGIAAVAGYAVGEALPMLAYSKIGPRVREVIPNGHSLTEYTYARYGSAMYTFVLLVSVLYMFIFLAAELTGIALALALVADVPQWLTAVLVGGFVLAYTGYGGLRASILTDTVQVALVLPLMVIAFTGAVVALGGTGAAYDGILAANPSLLDPMNPDGVRFGVAIALAIFGAELINQTWWQRIYAGSDAKTVARGFRTATVANGVIVLLAALFGVVAAGNASIENPSTAFFALLGETFPEWAVVAVTLLALLLVMSSVDTLFNALSSVVTADLPRLLDDPDDRTLSLGARALTIVVAVAAIYVSQMAQSVLALFLFADLLGAAIAVPFVYGLFSDRLTEGGALISGIAGLAIGTAFFPFPLGIAEALRSIPLIGAMLPSPDGLYLTSFAGAFVTSTACTLVFARRSSHRYDFDRLASDIRRLDDPQPDGGRVDDQEVNNQ
ncbi:sodium:proline symporter [Halorubrum rutilum]|uniref:Sodium:proline symporter n=1 Tax=Halorubrum rutilum TaxID=1364933 RepID=A0ABD6ANS0_9EURY|nr:sodium:proline symporter [Halorubrum rutilum]